ncbi:hypothetical protein RRG08_035258 [Elysia crispata]|uniref:PDEase domain-containing protein n=1 Tax=Elysia crispata TaxID=231223 RepID=A0AAE1DUI2_9GAST|nr:hypothetical protein RRG08_035258 [Elysia crispata]
MILITRGTIWPLFTRAEFYRQLKELILATDITRQPEFLQTFCRCIESGELQYRTNQNHRLIMLQIALKCADISNPCREWKISQRWSRRVCHEFFLQVEHSYQLFQLILKLYGGLGPGSSAPRCLSPVSKGGEMGSSELTADSLHSPRLNNSNNGRRFSVPAIVTVRKDLSFYLGLRRDNAGPSPSSSTGSFSSSSNLGSYSACMRRQSLPTTALYFHGSSQVSTGGTPDLSTVSPRSLSVDALLAKLKITSLSLGGLGEIAHVELGFQNMGNNYGHPANIISGNLGGEGNSSCSTTPSRSDPAIAMSGVKDTGGAHSTLQPDTSVIACWRHDSLYVQSDCPQGKLRAGHG